MIKSLLVASVLLAGHATAQECALVKVPVYQTQNEWAGMALGGLIGSQVGNGSGTVSYTHLTLPTIYSV